MLMVFLLLLLRIRELEKLLTLLSLMRKVDYLRKKLTDWSKRLKNIKSLMNRENNKLNLKTTLSNISIKSNLWSKMRKSKIKSLKMKENRSMINVKSYHNGYIVTRMLLKMSMRRRERNLKLFIIQLLLRFMVNKEKDSQVLKVSQVLELKDSQVLKNNRTIKEPISTILTEINNFKHFIF